MTGKVKVGVAIALLAILVIAFGVSLWINRSFQAELGSYRTVLIDRTEAQRHNIQQAASAVDGVVIEPGDIFSFNEIVGPRNPERGYRIAPAYMERSLVTSIGGGVCQVSSTIYRAALVAGLKIIERHPHSRLVTSVPPGQDATVWWGGADLKFQNDSGYPITLISRANDRELFCAIFGKNGSNKKVVVQTNKVDSQPSRGITYLTLRTISSTGGRMIEVCSVDTYVR